MSLAEPLAPPAGGEAERDAIAPLADLADVAAFRAAVREAAASGDAQAGMVAACRTFLKEGQAAVRDRFERRPMAGLAAGRALTRLMDEVVHALFEAASEVLFPLPHPTRGERLAVVAVGGYGRGALAPGSDIDLLFVLPYKRTAWAEQVVETMLYALWDLKLKVGQATRSVDECLRLAKADMTIRTSLLETRLLAGDAPLYAECKERLRADLFRSTGREFVEAKLAERSARHTRAGDSRYLLEPNVKEGKGGLRDLHSLYWIGKYLYGLESSAELVEVGVLREDEARRFDLAERFLWTVRCWLHWLTGRATEHLTFELQREIAGRMGFEDREGRRAVEHFMSRYFAVAKEVGDLTRTVCAELEARELAPREGGARRLLALLRPPSPREEAMRMERGRLLVEDPAWLAAEPRRLVEVFHEAGRTGASIHPVTLNHVRRSLDLIGEAERTDPEANALFLATLRDARDPETILRAMNEAGVLGRFLPEFGRVVCMMQFNMYHSYTVDEHSIRAVGQLAALERGELAEAAPLSTEVMAGRPDRTVLYVATLLHDVGKGTGEDHSVAGARIAAQVCPRLGLDESQTETVVWLIRHHLLMSDTAQKRDLSEPRTIGDFCDEVRSLARLRMLLVLTTCDIRAVGPGVWNNWKATLLRQLYRAAEATLSAGHDGEREGAAARAERVEEAKAALAGRLSDWSDDERAAWLQRPYPPYWLGLDGGTHEVHARMIREASPADGPAIDVSGDAARSATRLSIAMNDHPGLFSRFTGAVSLSGAGIVDVRSYTTRDGVALATIWLQDEAGEVYDDPGRLERLRANIKRVLSGEVVARDALRERAQASAAKAREASFRVAPGVNFDNRASETCTVIEVTGRDRPGLLHDLARTLADQRVGIFSAVCATYGERAWDTFYVKDLFGHKITSASRQQRIEAALRAVLDGPQAPGP